jgi:glyoxylase-like metal-dependent hydrolase (beta-lactamase superfamily II)
MEEANISPSEIDFVILTHRDMDHIGGTIADGRPTFSNACYIIGRTEYDSYKIDPVRSHFQTYIAPIEEAGRLKVVVDDAIVSDGVKLMMTPGHRLGATSVIINDAIFISADVWHCASQVTHPEWQIKWDSEPNRAVETRRAVIDLAEEKGFLVSVPHTPYFGVGKIIRENHQQVWQSIL